MSATARDMETPGGELDETIAFARDPESGPDRPNGSPAMPTPQAQYRYTYGSGARPLDGYTIKRAIGRGGFGEVYYATSDSGKEVALKLVLRNLDVERRGVVQCMNLKCPNLLSIYDLRTNDEGDAFVVMEYVSGPSLENVLARHPNGLPVAEVRAWLKGLVEGVAYLHDHGVVHRDLKPANMFMEEGLVKIGDYGLAKLITPSQGTEHSESIGTCHYMAPEIASGKYHKPIDVYAIGVILFEMLTGRVPFAGETVGEVLMKHLTARPDVRSLPEPYRTIVARSMAKDPNQRPARVYDLLPAEDGPKLVNVRFIADGKAARHLPEGAFIDPPPPPRKDDGVFRIEAEEPVFYIGPETRPPLNQRFRTAFRRPRPAPAAAARPEPPRARPAVAPRPAPAPAPQPAPTPPPLPGVRVRVAELASAMLLAAPLAALLAFPVAVGLGVDLAGQPERVAFLFGMSLLGTWATLIPARLLEGRQPGPASRRTLNLGLGALVGLTGAALATWVQLGELPHWGQLVVSVEPSLLPYVRQTGWVNPLTYAAYFAGLSALGGWSWQARRDRPSRFRVVPVLRAGAVAAALGLVVPFPEPWGVGVAALTAVVTQSVSPWSEPAAAYARYAARAAKQRGRRVA